jgi:bifunctional UDP-N-acetylglucosamine pyrophosphorylase / glucosamine-1-phosphate N-acetyltransferase
MNIVILAAGMGKRMKSDLPKVLHPIAGRPMLAHVIQQAKNLRPTRIIVVHGHGAEQVRSAIAEPDVLWALQWPAQGTGHAVQQAAPLLDPAVPTLVLYGDVPLTRQKTLSDLAEAAGTSRLALLTTEMADPTGYGRIVRNDAGHVRAIVEEKDADAAIRAIREVNTGILVAPTAGLLRWLCALTNDNAQKEYYLTDIVAQAVAEGVTVVTAQPAEPWETLGVNSKAQLAQLERIFQREQAVSLMAEGVTLADPQRLDVRGVLRCGRDVFIDVNCVFEGDVVLEDGVQVGAHCVIRQTRIGKNTQILPFTMIEQATIAEEARIGPYSRLRPGSDLGPRVHVGNFTEIKASRLAADAKANHLSYVGDARVGERVNIGAGTITCNYDGANKHLTVIEDDVHIGSDTQLVAPVTVGRGSTTAAGTTVWRNVPEHSLVLNTKDQVERQGWLRPVKKPKD